LVLAPNGGNSSKIPNEDSLDLEFDDTNLFSASRFTGVDRVDSGQRFIYGVNWGLYGDHGGAIEAFLGQSYRLRSKSEFPEEADLRDQASDLVGRIRVSPGKYLDLLYRFRLDHKDLKAKRSEVRVSAGPNWLRGNVNYFYDARGLREDDFQAREEITLGFTAKLSRYWSMTANIREDLTDGDDTIPGDNGGTISQNIGFKYQDECLIFNIKFERSFTEDRDLKPKDTLFFQLIFKHLGGFEGTG
ncbi:MAG: LPS assembly protein LptD, partial [Alphaproteobacteria bacterium]